LDLKPVPFIIGMARSGTTMLRLMLDAHPWLAIPPELDWAQGLAGYNPWLRPLYAMLDRTPRGRYLSARLRRVVHHAFPWPMTRGLFLRIVTRDPRFGDMQIEPRILEQSLELETFVLAQAIRLMYGLYAKRFGKARWGSKTPGERLYMWWLQDLLPEARFIHLIRDGRDVAVSSREAFGGGTLRERAIAWRWGIIDARRQSKSLRHYYEVRYEDLVARPAYVLRTICDFIELPFDAAMLDYHRTASMRLEEFGAFRQGGVLTTREQRLARHTRVSSPPLQSRVGRWRTVLSAAEQREFWHLAGDTLEACDYAP
jgi:hypothetical protein